MLIEKRFQAQKLRRGGYSLKEIASRLGVAKSSASLWVRDIVLSEKAKKRLLTRITAGQFIAAENKKAHTRILEAEVLKSAHILLRSLRLSRDYNKLICAALYWCEGAKDMHHGVSFMNSDPDLMRKFLELFRESFALDEKKFKPLLHLHEYHNVSIFKALYQAQRRQEDS
jgi:transcriptional regulator with XRE-family HTH domain